MPRSTQYGGVYIEISGNIEPFRRNLQQAEQFAKQTARNVQNATDNFFNENQIKKITASLSKHLLNVKATAIACQKDISQFSRHFEHIATALGLAGKQAQAFGKDMENALKAAKEKSLERSMRSLQQQIGLTDQAYMRMANAIGATEAAMKKAQSVLGVRTYSQIRQEIKNVVEAYKTYRSSVLATTSDEKKASAEIRRAHAEAAKAIQRLRNEIRGVGNELKNTKSILDSFGKSTAIFLGGFFTTHAIVQGVREFASATIEATTALDRLKLAYSSIYEGTSGGKKQLDFIYEQAKKTGQEYVSLAESAKTFFAAGQNSTIKKEMNDIFESVNLAGAALQLSSTQMQRVYYAIGQMISKGKVSAEEMRQQLGEQLPGAFQIAAKAMGVTTAELDKMMADGKLMTEDFLPKFARALREEWGEAGARAANTMQGALNSVKTEFELLKASFIDSSSAVSAIKELANGFAVFKDFVNAGYFKTLTVALTGAVAGFVAFNGIAKVTSGALLTLGARLKGVVAFLGGPWAIGFAAATGIVAALSTAQEASTKINEQYKDSFSSAEEAIKNFNATIVGVTDAIKNMSQAEAHIALKKNINDYNELLDEASRYIERYVDENGYMVKAHDKLTLTFKEVWAGLQAGSISYKEAALRVNVLSGENAELAKKYLDLIIAMEKNRDANKDLTQTLDGTAQKFAGMISILGSVSGAILQVAADFETVRQTLAGGWSINTKDFNSAIKKMEDTIWSNQIKLSGLADVSDVATPFKNKLGDIDLGTLNTMINNVGKEGGEVLKRLGDSFNYLTNEEKDYFESLLIHASAIRAQNEKIKKLQESNKPKGGGAATKAANAQEDYNALLKKTNSELESIEEKFKYNSAEKVEKKLVDISNKYNIELGEIDKNINKMLNSKKISKAQAETLRKAQETLALKKKDLAIEDLREKQREQEMQHLQTQIGFYNELAELNGEYENSARLRISLIELEAKKFENIKGIPPEMIEQWKKFKQLQASTDWFDGVTRGLKKFTAEYGDSAKQWESLTYNFAKGFEQNVHDMFDDFIETGKVSFDSMAQLFKNLLKQMAYQALVQPIVLSVVNGVAGAMSGSTTQGGAVSGGSGLVGAASGMLQSAAMNKAGGVVLDTASNWIDSAAASIMPNTFAATGAQAAANAEMNSVASMYVGSTSEAIANASTTAPTQTLTGAIKGVSTLGNMAGGLIGGAIGNYLVVPALGIKETLGSQIGSTVLGTGGALAGAAYGATLGSWGGPIGAGIGALAGTVLGALGGSLFGGVEDEEPIMGVEGKVNLATGKVTSEWWKDNDYDRATANYTREFVRASLEAAVKQLNAVKTSVYKIGGQELLDSFTDALKEHGEVKVSGEWENESPDFEAFGKKISNKYSKTLINVFSHMDYSKIVSKGKGEQGIRNAVIKAAGVIALGSDLEDELKEKFEEGIKTPLLKALSQLNTDKIGLSVDKTSLEGWTKAAEAFQKLDEVTASIKEIENPTSEVGKEIQSLASQFTTWENELASLGWTTKKITEIDKKRVTALKEYANSVINDYTGASNKLKKEIDQISKTFTDLSSVLKQQGIDTATIKKVNEARRKSIDSYIDEAIDQFSDTTEEVINNVKKINDTFNDLREVTYVTYNKQQEIIEKHGETLRKYVNGVLDKYEEEGQAVKTLGEIADNFGQAIKAMTDSGDIFSYQDIARAQNKMASAMKKYVSSVTDSYKKTDTLHNSINEINNTFDDLIAGMKAVGMSSKDLTNAEKQRAQALNQLVNDTMKSYDQSLYLRYVSLSSGSDSSVYQLSQLVYTQQNELEDLANAIGKNNDEYRTTELIQTAEMLNTRINLLQNQLKNTLQNELTTANELLNTATSIRTTFESILRNLKQARQNLWTSDKNLATSRYSEANKQFNEVFAKAMSGDEEALKELPNIANTVLSLAKEQLNTRGEYDTAFYTISKKLKRAEDVAASQLKTAEEDIKVQQQLVASLNTEINGLGNTVGEAMEQSSEALRSLITTYQTQLTDLLKTIAKNSTTISNNTAKITLLNDGTSASKNAILDTKAELMKYGEALGKGQKAGNYTSDYILQAIAANGMTFDEWYTKYGSKEIIEAAKNTGTVINSISDLHKITDAYDKLLVDKANALNSQMVSTATVAAGGWTADLVRAEIASRGMTVKEWYDKYGKSEGFLLGTKNNTGSLNETLKAQTSSVNMSFTSWEDLLQKKADAMNAGLTLAGKQATGGWTADLVRQEIASRGMTVQEWYAKYGKAEGFLQSTSTNTKTTGDNVKTYTLSEGEKILAVKTALMNMGQTLSAGQKSSGNTMQSVLAEIEASGMTFSEWYTKYGKKEIDEAATNAGYIVGSTASMDEYTQSLLSSQTGVLSGWLSDVNKSVKSLQLDPSITNNFTPGITFSPTINVKVDQNGNVTVDKTVKDTSTSTTQGKTTTTTTNNNTSNNNTTTPKKISETVSSLSDTYKKALQTKTDAMVQGYLLASGQTMKNYTTAEVLKMINDAGLTFADWYKKYGVAEIKSLQTKTTKSTKYDSDYALLVAKADAMNKKKEQGRTNWRASTVLAEIKNKGLTLASWYDKYGKAEGFYKGGITPKNRAYWVGEKGPELLMSPQNYGILSNKDSMELMRGNSQNIYTSTGSVTTLDGGDKETHNILKQLLRKLTSQEYKIEKMQRIFDTWNHEGLPATATA